MLASSEYLVRYNRVMVDADGYGDVCCMGKRKKIIRSECEMVSRKVERGHVLENSQAKLV